MHAERPGCRHDSRCATKRKSPGAPLAASSASTSAFTSWKSTRARGATPCGWIGELHPELVRGLELPVAPQLFELDLDITCEAQLPAAKEISRFPAVRRDLAVVVAEATTFNELRESVTVAASSLLRELTVFDVYRGEGIDSGRKSVALGLILQDKSKTLTDADVDAVMAAVSARLKQDLGATLRD